MFKSVGESAWLKLTLFFQLLNLFLLQIKLIRETRC